MDPASDPSGRFAVGGEGEVRVVRPLDREAARAHTVLVWALDDGDPPNTATATLHVSVYVCRGGMAREVVGDEEGNGRKEWLKIGKGGKRGMLLRLCSNGCHPSISGDGD